MTYNKDQELDRWKDFILKLLMDRGGVSFKDFVWKQLQQEFDLSKDKLAHYRYTDSVLPCLEDEFQLIRTSGDRGIQLTEKGCHVARIGYRRYINTKEWHERVLRWKDYLGFVSGVLSIVSTLFSFLNLICELMDKCEPFILTSFFIIVFAVSAKSKKV